MLSGRSPRSRRSAFTSAGMKTLWRERPGETIVFQARRSSKALTLFAQCSCRVAGVAFGERSSKSTVARMYPSASRVRNDAAPKRLADTRTDANGGRRWRVMAHLTSQRCRPPPRGADWGEAPDRLSGPSPIVARWRRPSIYHSDDGHPGLRTRILAGETALTAVAGPVRLADGPCHLEHMPSLRDKCSQARAR